MTRHKYEPDIAHLERCDADPCDRCTGLMEMYQTCERCHRWGHNSVMVCEPPGIAFCPTCADKRSRRVA